MEVGQFSAFSDDLSAGKLLVAMLTLVSSVYHVPGEALLQEKQGTNMASL